MITAVDIVVGVVLLGSAGFAFLRGFMHEVLSIAAWVGAVFAALYGLPVARPFFREHIGTIWIADAAAGLSLFLVTLLVLSIITKRISDRVRKSALNSVDSSLGFVFGLVRGAVLLSLVYLLALWAFGDTAQPDWIAKAKTRPWLDRGARMIQLLAPEGFGMAESAARTVSEDARKAAELERAYRALTAPMPTAPQPAARDAAPATPGQSYDKEQRRELDRLFQTNKQ